MIWFTADTHFNHANIKYCNRPFTNVEEMNKTISNRWKDVVAQNDIVYHLGDVGFGDLSILKQLPGKINLIKGGHDRGILKYRNRFESIYPLLEIIVAGVSITLCHYAMRVWNKSHFNSWHLYGHSHGTLPPIGKSWDVGVDNNDFYPISLEQIKDIMKGRPNNPNLVE